MEIERRVSGRIDLSPDTRAAETVIIEMMHKIEDLMSPIYGNKDVAVIIITRGGHGGTIMSNVSDQGVIKAIVEKAVEKMKTSTEVKDN